MLCTTSIDPGFGVLAVSAYVAYLVGWVEGGVLEMVLVLIGRCE